MALINKINSSFKKTVKYDWHAYFPLFVIDKKWFKMSRRVGPLLISIGFEVKSSGDRYYPGWGVHNLSFPSDFLTSVLNVEARTIKTGAQASFSVRAHESGEYKEVAERFKSELPFPADGLVELSMILSAYRSRLELYGPRAVDLLRDPPLIAAWALQLDLARQLLGEMEPHFKSMSEGYQQSLGGYDNWYADMLQRISSPQKLREIVEEQAKLHKVDHIPQEELVID